MLLKVMAILTVLLTIVLGHADAARAQCGSWACNGSSAYEWSTSANPGRIVLNTTESTNRNVGLRFDANGSAEWSLATVKITSGAISYQAFQLYNDNTATLAVELGLLGHLYTRELAPFSNNTHDLGYAGAPPILGPLRWRSVYTANGTFPASDARLKTDVTDLRYGLEEVVKLRPVTFKWKAAVDDATHIGLIAQEVDKLVPEVVRRDKGREQLLGLAYAELVPILIKAIQSQRQTIESHAARIVKLEEPTDIAAGSYAPGALGAGVFLAALPSLGLVAVLRRRRRAQ